MDDIFAHLKEDIMSKIEPGADMSEDEVWEAIDRSMDGPDTAVLSFREKAAYRKKLFNEIRRLDILQELIDDDDITEIMINGWENIYFEKDGRVTKWDKHFTGIKNLNNVVQRIAANSNKIINESVPISDTRLSDGSRVNIVMNPIAIDGPVVTIRKFYSEPISMEKMIALKSITREAADFLEMLVRAKYNLFISGGTGSGKTTMLGCLSDYIPGDERVITIEDSAELKLHNIDNLVRLEARNANIEGNNEITIRDLIKSALRMRPDRIIVGEVRGKEALDMLQAMQTGHDGSLSTGHANNPEDMMLRLETMVLMGMDMPVAAIRGQIASALDVVVHLGRLRDKSRRVLSISEVVGIENGVVCLNRLFNFEEEGCDENGKIIGALKWTGNKFNNTEKLKLAGINLPVFS